MTSVTRHRVAAEEADQRLDRWFRRRYPRLPFARLQRFFRTGQVRLDGKRVKGSERLKAGQEIRVPPIDVLCSSNVKPKHPMRISEQDVEAIRGAVLYRDEAVLVIDKPAGLATQGGSRQSRHLDALLPALAFEKNEPPKLVHRLDRDTSGLLLLARTRPVARALTAAFRENQVSKLYWAAVKGCPKSPSGSIDVPIAKGGGRSEKMHPNEKGQEAITHYTVIESAGKRAAWLALRPVTGRTHQLRVHCAAIGHPILGDGKYGGKAAHPEDVVLPGRLLLHARQIAFAHPEDGTTLRIEAPLPAPMLEAWKSLGFDPDNPRTISFDT